MDKPNLVNGFKVRMKSKLESLFPERQVVLRTEGAVACYRISKRLQVSVATSALAAMVWFGYSSVSYFINDTILQTKDNQVLAVQVAYRSLLKEVSDYQRKFSSISRELEENHTMMLGLVEQNATLQQNLRSVETQLQSAETEREKIEDARERLKANLNTVQSNMHQLASRNYLLKDDLSETETDLQVALSERNAAMQETKNLRERVATLEGSLVELNETQRELVSRLTDTTSEQVADLEKVVLEAGLDPDALISQLQQDSTAQGGPFVAHTNGEEANAPEDKFKQKLVKLESEINRLQSLQQLTLALPLAAPVDYYYISSNFGKRQDPVNNRWAMHYGLDMAGTLKSPIYVTAPGKVTFAGRHGNYGNLIEIDHGNGIVTRYGHLYKILVKTGETVDYRTKIGLLGNTGRSTGAHLHYEIKVDGKNRDPMKFIKAGRHVLQG